MSCFWANFIGIIVTLVITCLLFVGLVGPITAMENRDVRPPWQWLYAIAYLLLLFAGIAYLKCQ